MQSESSRMTTAEEAKFRISAPNSKPRAIKVIALDKRSEAMVKKLRYNPEVRRVMLATGDLKLKPDHHEEACLAPEWKYYKLWMEIRKEVMRGRILAPVMPLIP